MKRIFDFLLSIFLIFLLALPSILIAILVKITSKGNVLYWSDRVGKNNIIFKMPKFRTMKKNTPELASHLLVDTTSALTPIGNLLRKYSLDEIPQLFNVILGDINLVGNRPLQKSEFEMYNQNEQEILSTVKNGVTGLWQVSGRSNIKAQERRDIDVRYAQNKSFWLDIKIIFKTIVVVLGRFGSH